MKFGDSKMCEECKRAGDRCICNEVCRHPWDFRVPTAEGGYCALCGEEEIEED